MNARRILLFLTFLLAATVLLQAQPARPLGIRLTVLNPQGIPVSGATIELRDSKASLFKTQVADSNGKADFDKWPSGPFTIVVTGVGYTESRKPISPLAEDATAAWEIRLEPASRSLQDIRVISKKPLIELKPDRTVINLDAGITNTGTTVLEALEKMPGVSVDKDGNISLKGKAGVLVLIDDKPTYLGSTELAALLGGMNASQVNQVELMTNPPARYDASGNSGIINIRTKKNKQKGYNGSVSLSYGQGRYPKSNNSVQLNLRTDKINYFLNYSLNANRNYSDLYALRTYYKSDAQTVASLLEQQSPMRSRGTSHNLRAGMDYTFNKRTSAGLAATGFFLDRRTDAASQAFWMDAGRKLDSVINTSNRNANKWKSGGLSFNLKHVFNARSELTADADVLRYRINGDQFFENAITGTYIEAYTGSLPASINIVSGKADWSYQLNQRTKFDAGWKSSRIHTDNSADYFYRDGTTWQPDLGKTNHFLYTEHIHAFYGNLQSKAGRWSGQAGLRYEMTNYDANQLGNAARKDSSFSRQYNSLFPTAFLSFEADSNHTLTLSAGRRIDRPAFQKLNPFVFIINKYTYQQGNPFYRPQYSWNLEASHSYKGKLVTTASYSVTKDYFSQIFLEDTAGGTIIYTEGNLGRLRNFGLSVSYQLDPAKWWSVSGQAAVNHKKLEGVISKSLKADVTQGNFSLNNQFRFKKGWAAELTGFYVTQSQQDIQEIVEPSGQVSAGLSKPVFKSKATLKFSVRDIFYTQAMKGFTTFQRATESFSFTRDTRVATLSLTWRFGKPFKAARRSSGSAADEIQRVGN
ncbi:MAG TPA: outer membrane beta-barrel protein [Flavisolibacter sp.]|jgi:hypothetical protein|nr:outer membrane beta-barrel protein [Flavisolibacter sp.]